jgi:hypothetical protein
VGRCARHDEGVNGKCALPKSLGHGWKTQKQNDEVRNKVEAVMEGDFIEHERQRQAARGRFSRIR